jgi:type II secretory pathway component PulC
MTKSFRLALYGIGAIAGLALLVELVAPILAISPDTLESSRARSERVTQKKADAMVAEIIKRPLFTSGREPPQMKVVKAEPPRLQGRLAGVMMQADLREALFSRPGARPVTVKEGEMIDGWTVQKIETDRVLLTSAFGEQVVRPTNGGTEEVTAPAARPVVKKTAPTQQIKPSMPPKRAGVDAARPLFAGDLARGGPKGR